MNIFSRLGYKIRNRIIGFAYKTPEKNTSGVKVGERIPSYSKMWDRSNPDDLVIKYGSETLAYKPISQNYIVKSAEDLLRQIALTVPYHITIDNNDDNPQNQDIIEFIEDAFKKLKCNFKDFLDALLDARIYGFVVAEKVFEVEDDKYVLKDLKFHPQEYFDIIRDEFLNIKILQYIGESGVIDFSKPLDSFIIGTYPYLTQGNYYGTSEYHSIRNLVKEYEDLTAMMDQGLQFIANKPIIHHFPTDRNPTITASINAAIDQLDNTSILHIEMKEILDATGKGDFKELDKLDVLPDRASVAGLAQLREQLEKKEKLIKRSLGVPDDMGFTDTEMGSYAKAKEQGTLLVAKVERMQLWLEDIINNQIIKQLIDLNYPDCENYPIFFFEETEEEVTTEKVNNIKTLIDAGVVHPDESWIRTDYLILPEKEEIEEEIIDEMPIDQPIQQPIQDEIPQDGEKPVKEPVAEPIKEPVAEQENKPKYQMRTPENQGQPANYARLDGDLTNYQFLRNSFNRIDNESTSAISDLYSQLMKEMIKRVPNIVQNPRKMNDEKLFPINIENQINWNYEKAILDTYLIGKQSANQILEAKNKIVSRLGNSLPIREFKNTASTIKYLEEKIKILGIIMTKADKETLRLAVQQSSLTSTTQIGDIERKVRQMLLNNTLVKSGEIGSQGIAQLSTKVQEIFNPFIITGAIAEKSAKPYIVDTTLKTLSSQYFNQARMNTFNEPEYRSIISAYQYSAILDDRTTDICNSLHGKIINASDGSLSEYIPPNHFNCRSLFIPLTIAETYKPNWNHNIKPQTGFNNI